MPEGQAPWDKDGEKYDEEKARNLIVNLRQEKSDLQSRLAQAETDRDTYKSRLDNTSKNSKTKTNEVKELEKENIKLHVQIQTGLDDKQVNRLVGDTLEEKLEDAKAYAEETGIELRSIFEEPGGTPDDQGQDEEKEKPVERNYRAPGGPSRVEEPFNPKDFLGVFDL